MVFALRAGVQRLATSSLRTSVLSASTPSLATRQIGAARTLTASANRQGKVLLVLYDVRTLPFLLPWLSANADYGDTDLQRSVEARELVASVVIAHDTLSSFLFELGEASRMAMLSEQIATISLDPRIMYSLAN